MTKDTPGAELGREIRRRRTARGMTLETLAERAGLTMNFIGSIEIGNRDPSLSSVLALAKGLGIMPSELFSTTEGLGTAAEEAGRLFDESPPEIQESIWMILRTLVLKRRR
jgi:transcriptional regulator with XRE-family HTH domain